MSSPSSPDIVAATAAEMARHIARDAETRGWGQPSAIYGIYGADASSFADLFPEVLSDKPEEMSVGWFVRPVAQFGSHPVDWLAGRRAESEMLGAALVTEAWGYPDDVLAKIGRVGNVAKLNIPPPSQHPRRVEIRLVQVLFRDGTYHGFATYRGSDRVEEVSSQQSIEFVGKLIRHFRRYMGLPSAKLPDLDPRDVLAHLVDLAGSLLVENPNLPYDIMEVVAVSPHPSAKLPVRVVRSVCQMLCTPLGVPIALAAPHLLRDSWEGFAADVLKATESFPVPPRDQKAHREWCDYLDWADDALLAWYLCEDLVGFGYGEPVPALDRFEQPLASHPNVPGPVVDLYLAWIAHLAKAI